MMRLTRRPALAATPLAAALILAMTVGASAQVASLVSPDESPEPETAETMLEFEDQTEAMLAYAECLRDNGIDVDDPQAGVGGLRAVLGGGPDSDGPRIDRRSEEFQAANEACSVYLEASRPEIDPEAEQERLVEQLQLAQCIRDSGYPEYPDPAIGTDGRLERTRGRDSADIGIDPRSPEFREVISACRDELGMEAGGLGPGGFGRGSGGN
jgi:hypothetical protein